jgi:hypothetical protein
VPARAAGRFPDFPFGSDFTDVEVVLAKVVRRLKATLESPVQAARTGIAALTEEAASDDELPYLKRLALDRPRGLEDRVLRRLVLHGLREVVGSDPYPVPRRSTD